MFDTPVGFLIDATQLKKLITLGDCGASLNFLGAILLCDVRGG